MFPVNGVGEPLLGTGEIRVKSPITATDIDTLTCSRQEKDVVEDAHPLLCVDFQLSSFPRLHLLRGKLGIHLTIQSIHHLPGCMQIPQTSSIHPVPALLAYLSASLVVCRERSRCRPELAACRTLVPSRPQHSSTAFLPGNDRCIMEVLPTVNRLLRVFCHYIRTPPAGAV